MKKFEFHVLKIDNIAKRNFHNICLVSRNKYTIYESVARYKQHAIKKQRPVSFSNRKEQNLINITLTQRILNF